MLAALRHFQEGREGPYKKRLPRRACGLCSYVRELLDLLRLVDLAQYRDFCDLGSGDGRAVLLAALSLPGSAA